MPTTVTLKSVWNKRNEFPEHVEMSVNLKGRWDSCTRGAYAALRDFEPKSKHGATENAK